MEEKETSFNYESMTNPKDQEVKFIPGEDGQPIPVYPSMEGQGFEGVSLPHGHQYGGSQDVPISELPQTLINRIRDAARLGYLDSLLSSYEGFLEKECDVFDSKTLENLKSLFAEGKQTKPRDESQKVWIEKTVSFIKGLNMTKNPNYEV